MNNILKFTAASAAALAISSASLAVAAPDASIPEIKQIQDRGVLKVGVKNAVIGFSVEDPLTGEYKGFEDDLARLIAKDLGVDVEFTAVTAATRTELIDSGDLDVVLATFTISDERISSRVSAISWNFRQRDNTVVGIFCGSVVAKINLTYEGGSSSVFSKALKLLAVSICTSSMI